MLTSETSLQRKAGEKNSPTTSQAEVAVYVANLSSELQVLARQAGLSLLSHLLSMVALAAKDMSAKTANEEPSSRDGPQWRDRR